METKGNGESSFKVFDWLYFVLSSLQFPVWKSLGVTALCGAGLLYYFNREHERIHQQRKRLEVSGVIGKPKLGGHLFLTDYNGATFDSSKLNKFMLVYFGFTHCPDVCPEELDKMSAIMRILEEQKDGVNKVLPVFVTIDPQRDGPSQIKEYLKGTTALLHTCG